MLVQVCTQTPIISSLLANSRLIPLEVKYGEPVTNWTKRCKSKEIIKYILF